MGEVWVAAIGVAVTAAGTAYSINAQQDAIHAANSAKPAKFVPVNIPKTQAQALGADISGYQLSDEDFAKRFPQLAKGRTYAIDDMRKNLEGGVSDTTTNYLNKAGFSGAYTGGTESQKARALGQPIASIQQRDRNYFQRILGSNPQRQFGLSGQDIARIAVTNTNNQNLYNQGLFGSRINQYNSQVQQNIQNQGAIVSGIAGVATGAQGLYNNYQQSRYLDPSGSAFATPFNPYQSGGQGGTNQPAQLNGNYNAPWGG